MSKRTSGFQGDDVLVPLKNGEHAYDDETAFSDEDSDEYESDEDEILQQSGSSDEEGPHMQSRSNQPEIRAWLPGAQLGEGEVLEPDISAYEMLHNLNAKWPCLSIDTIWDDLGQDRRSYPATLYFVAGTQADQAMRNEVQVMKCSNLAKTHTDDNSSASSSDDGDENPVLTYKSLPVTGAVNRVRATKQRGDPRIIAAMVEDGTVNLWYVDAIVASLDDDASLGKSSLKTKPNHIIRVHRAEGFALDWSNLEYGRLITGDNQGQIYLTSCSSSGECVTDPSPFRGHEGSIEDLQWSPTEKTVFASCSSDGTIRIWDTRSKKRTPAISVKASDSDVNVISWNRTVAYLLASGCDDGKIDIWDLRTFTGKEKRPTPVASFNWHKEAITSIQWHPKDESVLVASAADHQITIWDFSVELDAEELEAKHAEGLGDVPPQLMFVHMGQQNVKEIRWSDQLPGVIISTAAMGFNIFKSAHQS